LGLGGCASLSFYGQALSGQWALLAKSRPVAEVQADATTPDALVQGLAEAQQILRFAENTLALPVGHRYQRYLALDREAVVFNVFSVPPGTFALKTWCFPIAGCVPYRGYFSREDARAEGDRLRAQGHDVYLGAAGAYSTLGWLPDPLLSTFPWEDSAALAELLFHELAHSVLYVPGEAAFNEAFATAVGRAGRERWVATQGLATAEAQGARSAQRACFAGVVSALRVALAERFAGSGPGPSQAAQATLWAAARNRVEALALGPGAAAYFSPPHSLARLLATSTYEQAVPAFEAALAAEGGDLPAFYAAMAALDPGQRQALMATAGEPVGAEACAAPL
jgi:predicted aminopeptidase